MMLFPSLTLSRHHCIVRCSLYGSPYNEASDIWSLGLIVVQLWTGKYPFSPQECITPLDLIGAIENMDFAGVLRGGGGADVSPAMVKFVAAMMAPKVENRATARFGLCLCWSCLCVCDKPILSSSHGINIWIFCRQLLDFAWFPENGIGCLADAQEV